MEPVMKRIRLAKPYVLHPDTSQIYGFYQTSVRWPDGKRELYDSDEQAKAAIEERAVSQAAIDAEIPEGVEEAILHSQPKPKPPPEEKAPEKDSFDVVLIGHADGKKISVIKVVRELTGKGLKESKEVVSSMPQTVLADVGKDAAEGAQAQLEAAGAKVELK